MEAIHPRGCGGLVANIAVCTEFAGVVAGHGVVAENELHLRVNSVNGLQLNAYVVRAEPGLLLESSNGVGHKGKFFLFELVAQGEGIHKAEAVVIGTGVAATMVCIVEVMHVFQGKRLVAGFRNVELVSTTQNHEALVLPAEFTLEAAAIAVNISVVVLFGRASAVISHELQVKDIRFIRRCVVEPYTPVGVQAELVGDIRTLNAGDAGIGHAEITGEVRNKLTGFHAEPGNGSNVLLEPNVIQIRVGEVALGAATFVGAAGGQAADAGVGMELRTGVHEHVYTNPRAAELAVEG